MQIVYIQTFRCFEWFAGVRVCVYIYLGCM